MNSEKKLNMNTKLWKWIAIIAGAFALLMCFLLIANYIQINRLDPVNTEAVNTLVTRLSENPDDEALRNEIRALDLLVRKAYFTNQWQLKTGGYILLISIALMLVAIQILRSTKAISPMIQEKDSAADQILKQLSRKWVSIGGGALVILALGLTFLTHERMELTFTEAAIAEETKVDEEPETSNDIQVTKVAQADIEQASKQAEDPKNEEVKEATNEDSKPEEVKEIVQEQPKIKKETAATSQESVFAEARNHFPSFRGAGSMGISYQKNVPTSWDGASNQNVLWKVKLEVDGYNSPIIWEDKLFITGANADKREVFCYNKNTGALIWVTEIANVPGSPAASPDVTDDTGHAAPTAATDGKHVYSIFSNGDVAAIDFNGNVVWTKNLGLPQNHYGHSSSLLVYKDKLIVQYDHGRSAKVLALNTANGNEEWSTQRKVRISWASPVIIERDGKAEIVLIADPNIAAYDPDTGAELWKIDCIYGEVGPSIAYDDGIVYGINEYASLVAITGGNQPSILWEAYDYLSDVPTPVVTNGLLFVVTSYGVIVCHDAKTGEIYWEQEYGAGFYSSPILVGDLIYLIDREGMTHIIKAQKEFELAGQAALGEEVVSTPAFADGQIFIRAYDHLYCIGTAN
ncbi:MAG: hypothetical protein CL663_00510 [Bacteroidetes bacterium]|nr:hypothetical protein [Bacteroidota bacterium]